MNFLDPIREKGKVKEIYEHLKNSNKENAERDAFLFLFSVYVGLRISDVRLFKVSDCMKKSKIFSYIFISLVIFFLGLFYFLNKIVSNHSQLVITTFENYKEQ